MRKNISKIIFIAVFLLMLIPNCVLAETAEELYNRIVKDGKIYLDTIKPQNMDDSEGLLAYACGKYSTDKFTVYCNAIDETYNKGDINFFDRKDENNPPVTKRVEFVYGDYDKDIYERIKKYKDKFPTEGEIETNLFRLDDLEIINYINNGGYGKTFSMEMTNKVINYSGDFNKILGNSNIKAILDARAGWDEMFTHGGFGFVVLTYNGFAYNVVNTAGVKGNKVLYIPSSTEDTREAFILAAKKRIKDYLEKDIEITYGGQITDIDEDNNWTCIPMEEVVNVDNTLGEYYIFTINGEDYEFFIEKNDSKMKNDVVLTTKDFITGSSITTASSSVPLDSKIQYNLVDKNSVEYKELMEKLGLKMGLVADIKLFSNVKDSYITKLDDGTFKVYIAINNDMNLADLKAYYLKDDGTKEIHDVTIENGYAVFETNHFSTYVLGSTTEISNPSTLDNVSLYVGLLLISMIGATSAVVCLKKVRIK